RGQHLLKVDAARRQTRVVTALAVLLNERSRCPGELRRRRLGAHMERDANGYRRKGPGYGREDFHSPTDQPVFCMLMKLYPLGARRQELVCEQEYTIPEGIYDQPKTVHQCRCGCLDRFALGAAEE